MIQQIAMPTERATGLHKQRCSTDNSTLAFWTEEGLSLRCRHCKGVEVVSWEEILRKHTELLQTSEQ